MYISAQGPNQKLLLNFIFKPLKELSRSHQNKLVTRQYIKTLQVSNQPISHQRVQINQSKHKYNNYLITQMYKQDYAYENLPLSQKARSNFVTKVFSIVGIQLFFTTLAVALNMYSRAFAKFQIAHTSVMWISAIGAIASCLVLSFSQTQSKTFPNNMGWLGLFTVCESYMVSAITSMYTPESVLLCAAATVAATVGLALYAMTTKSDFTSVGNSVTAFGLSLFNVIFWVSLINVFFVKSSFMDLLLSVALSIVYMIYLLIDIQLVMGGKRNNLTLDNYVMGAMMIYMDIVSLFIKLLKIFGKKKDD